MDGWGRVPAVVGPVFLAAFIGLLMRLILSTVRKPVAAPGGARALLDERYAKGEIEREDIWLARPISTTRKADLDQEPASARFEHLPPGMEPGRM